ncbi:unnamed protein product [Paramecium octaurelia]|uniref:Uncharacterized protein n=1 Tax=Paramecium octaurelia TaxID=43137 RepID=A0A8S1W8Q2_PAROT|nr:unnamed protein product [Paramecium octaurelia]
MKLLLQIYQSMDQKLMINMLQQSHQHVVQKQLISQQQFDFFRLRGLHLDVICKQSHPSTKHESLVMNLVSKKISSFTTSAKNERAPNNEGRQIQILITVVLNTWRIQIFQRQDQLIMLITQEKNAQSKLAKKIRAEHQRVYTFRKAIINLKLLKKDLNEYLFYLSKLNDASNY